MTKVLFVGLTPVTFITTAVASAGTPPSPATCTASSPASGTGVVRPPAPKAPSAYPRVPGAGVHGSRWRGQRREPVGARAAAAGRAVPPGQVDDHVGVADRVVDLDLVVGADRGGDVDGDGLPLGEVEVGRVRHRAAGVHREVADRASGVTAVTLSTTAVASSGTPTMSRTCTRTLPLGPSGRGAVGALAGVRRAGRLSKRRTGVVPVNACGVARVALPVGAEAESSRAVGDVLAGRARLEGAVLQQLLELGHVEARVGAQSTLRGRAGHVR